MASLSRRKAFVPYPHQVMPQGAWRYWIMLCGRFAGKTRGGAEHTLDYLRKPEAAIYPACISGPTIGNTWAVCLDGPGGLLTHHGSEFYVRRSTSPGKLVHKTSGGIAWVYGADEPARFDGPGFGWVWADELGRWDQHSWQMIEFCLREGPHPRAIITTTPKQRQFIKKLCELSTTAVTRATSRDNPAIDKGTLDYLLKAYEGTRVGRQEIEGEFIEEIEGALWKVAWIDERRVNAAPADMIRVVVAVDPAGKHKPENCETGIVVVGRGRDGDDYVLESDGLRASPAAWADRAVYLYDKWRADCIVGEQNYGGDMVLSTLRNATFKADGSKRTDVKFKMVTASRGKVLRAEPSAARYEQGHVHHVGDDHHILEEEMTSFGAKDTGKLRKEQLVDRVDALVHAMAELGSGKDFFGFAKAGPS